ncbi:MAG: hypothetical protein HYY04_05195, partial [Chloroflexi bacterium]|nr:hypothetical protein [Chloroflexota bacterium]
RTPPRPVAVSQLLLSLGVAALAYLPWLWQYARERSPGLSEPALSGLDFLLLWALLTAAGVSADVERWAPLALPWLVLVVAGCLELRRSTSRSLALAVALGFPLALYGLSLSQNILYPARVEARYLLLGLPFSMLVAAAGGDRLWRGSRWLGGLVTLAFLATLAAGVVGTLASRVYADDLRALGTFVRTYADPSDVVLLNPDRDWPVYAYYLGRASPPLGIPSREQLDAPRADYWVSRLVGSESTVWLVQPPEAGQTDPTGEVRRWLEARYALVADLTYGQTHVTVFSREGVEEVFDITGRIEPSLFQPMALQIGTFRLLGVRRLPRTLRAGQTLYLDVLWKAGQPPRMQPEVSAVVRDLTSGQTIVETDADAVRGRPLSQMGQADTALTEFALPIARSVPSGQYQVALRFALAGTRFRREIPVQAIRVTGTKGSPEGEAHPSEALDVRLGEHVALLGFDLPTRALSPEDDLELTLYWSALQPLRQSYTVFIHLADSDERILAQVDRLPDDGSYPTDAWAVGEVVVDDYQLRIPPESPPGVYRLLVGMYDQATQQRLPATDSPAGRVTQDRIWLGDVEVR